MPQWFELNCAKALSWQKAATSSCRKLQIILCAFGCGSRLEKAPHAESCKLRKNMSAESCKIFSYFFTLKFCRQLHQLQLHFVLISCLMTCQLVSFSLLRCAFVRNMTSLLDSTAHFEERCARLGMGQGFVTALAGVQV